MNVEVLIADYLNENQAVDIGFLLNHYAEDPMGGGLPLSDFTKDNLAKELSKIPHAFSVICYVDGKPAGLINCFEAFSTFKCKPLINIHDIVVVNEFRGLGISQSMLAKVEERAREKGCCKITLEVLEGNEVAQNSYIKFGFNGYELDPKMGKALFWQKLI
ncbi:GNAT family N-acetyltransferase [Pseudoalteromonas byunsanensis]|uniref:GNAT family N-acetyltransferase n=1 Tax=Pseudoalteromonas byunsanensis TaxID=327939 RepID=A0A1S1N6J6_9GAMM|nr:GNAT family N-acetyltransferase [Pseudoalteromonas byunsanensis]OHU94952.1 GNAT family N-acetyltransferase [Pseudoalteromonas byunsanensis]